MKSHLSHVLPVSEACSILGEATVRRICKSFLAFRHQKVDPQEEILLINALTFTEETVPTPIQNTWNRYTKRTMGLEKMSLLKWIMPLNCAPHSGQGGHLGLFDCFVHALSASANHHASSITTGGIVLAPVVLLPDLLICLAISSQYASAATERLSPKKKKDDSHEYAVMMLSVLAFRVYDSYLKKGMVVRDTLHRFVTDIYGEDSFREPNIRKVLDKMYANPDEPGQFLPSLSGGQFCQAIQRTVNPGHVLLDWLAKLVVRLIPPGDLPLSTQAYLETISSSHRSLEKLCLDYGLAETSRLYEVKRRFHSLVESSNIIHGDPMSPDVQESRPRHLISLNAFTKAVTSGGYLPESLAKVTFQAACMQQENDEEGKDASNEEPEYFWALFDVLQFGCHAVRQRVKGSGKKDEKQQPDLELYQFCFSVFSLLPGGEGHHHTLTRTQVAHMLLLLLEHAAFRVEADSPETDDDDEDEEAKSETVKNENDIESTMVQSAEASLLGVLPPDARNPHVPLKALVNHVLGGSDSLTLDALMEWDAQASHTQQRLGPYLLDLRFIAAVVFGIPPSFASCEKLLVEESNKRHKYKYPQTDVSRRGPRGTVWYIIDAMWLQNWQDCVKKVSGTPEDGVDNREMIQAPPRGLGKINNTSLLADNGSLALRVDLKLHTDYEIITPVAWSALQAWYDGGPPISRTVVPYIPTGAPSPHSRQPRVRTAHEIELYPFFVTVFMCDTLSRGEARPFQQYVPVSRVNPVRVLLLQLCKGLDVDPRYGRLWMMENASTTHHNSESEREVSDWLLNLDASIVEQRDRRASSGDLAENGNSITLLLELKDVESGMWPRGVDGKTWMFDEDSREGAARLEPGIGDGVVGLYNMGNTCYLNSSIQCLSHTPIFREYFTSKVYLHDVNTTNPLGYEGRLAQVSAVLINKLWQNMNQTTIRQPKRVTAPGSYAHVNAPALTPKTFKDALGKFNDHFSGNEQHDAQELLAFLLGGLSEDLNRIVDKPYIEAPDSDGRPDSELADIWWSNHLKREMSIIVALFTGQYKSLLTCRSCKYESARFEPFSFLQLPLPEDDQISVSILFYPLREGEEVTKYSVRVRHDGTLFDVLMSLAKVIYADKIAAEETTESQSTDAVPPAKAREKEEDEPDPELEATYKTMALNMAVVDLREGGWINKIAPNTWKLPDLQNKDTGELPVFHVYEMDPLPEGENVVVDPERHENPGEDASQTSDDESDAEGKTDVESPTDTDGVAGQTDESDAESGDDADEATEKKNDDPHLKRVKPEAQSDDEPMMGNEVSSGVKFSFLALAQRKTEYVSDDQLHPFSHQVFGTPLLLRVVDLEGYSGRDLYDLVAKRLRNFVPKSALRFLTDNNDAPREDDDEDDEQEDKSDDSGLKPRAGSRKRRHRTTTDMEDVAAGPVPRYGFRLRLVSRNGQRCALCSWYECCIGCLVPDDDYPSIVTCGDSLAIDWHFAVDIATHGFGLRANQLEVPTGQTSQSRAKQPIVTIPTKIHSSCGEGAKMTGYPGAITLEDCLDAFAKEERIPEAYCSCCKEFRVQTKRMSLWRLPPVVIIQLKRFQFTQHARRKLRDLVTFPVEGLDLSRIVARDSSPTDTNILNGTKSKESDNEDEDDDTTGTDEEEEEDEEGSNKDEEEEEGSNKEEEEQDSSHVAKDKGRSHSLYDLYGVVHHQGALSGGHYVASLKSELDGQWRMFNDAQIYEIHSRDIVDASAYILFYIRRDAKDAQLHDFWEAREGEGLTEEEMDKLMKGRSERCVIS